MDCWHGQKVIRKRRISKSYRVPQLDLEIRHSRTIREAQLIHGAKKAGIPTPTIYMVDTRATEIVMEYVKGTRVKEALPAIGPTEGEALCKRLGQQIGRLHAHGIIHGDLTTSNMIVAQNGKVYFIDFGLGEYSREMEQRGVDLLLLRRALNSTHHDHAKECFKAIIEGYAEEVGEERAREAVEKVNEISKRGRYMMR